MAGISGWLHQLAALSPNRPLGGIDPDLWRRLLTDARWLADLHGDAAAALGWTASDLFGVDLLPGWGGLVDRLCGARTLLLSEAVAHWQGEDEEGWLWRKSLRPMQPIWLLQGRGTSMHDPFVRTMTVDSA